jgi:hypothetical protein
MIAPLWVADHAASIGRSDSLNHRHLAGRVSAPRGPKDAGFIKERVCFLANEGAGRFLNASKL